MAISTIKLPYSRTAATYKGGVDADDYLTAGHYHVGITSHSPTGNTDYGILVVWTGSDYWAQMYIGNSGVYTRYRPNANEGFRAWVKLD